MTTYTVISLWEDGLRYNMHETWVEKLKPLRELAKIPHYAITHKRYENPELEIYPPAWDRFNAFKMPFNDLKVVIIGQDPYHGKGQANGLAFSVNKGIPVPPSLQNIYKELESDLGIKPPMHGDLSSWVNQGILLLNTSLSVEANKPASHKDIGWYPFIKGVIKLINKENNIVFILWGKHAQGFIDDIDQTRNTIIKSSHPSPYSADYGFFSSRPFSRCNSYLNSNGKQIIDWEIK
jgi:uracil-DNA glycosylase